MENWGLITYGEESIAVNPATTPATQRLNVATIIAHEIAHHVSSSSLDVSQQNSGSSAAYSSIDDSFGSSNWMKLWFPGIWLALKSEVEPRRHNNNNLRFSKIRVSNRTLICNVCPKSALTWPSRHSIHRQFMQVLQESNQPLAAGQALV